MSNLMLLGILRMPDASIGADCASLMQFVSAARGAADRIESDAKIIEQLRAELEAAAADKRRLSMELMGVIIDTERGYGFDDVCLATIKRVEAALAQRQGEGS